MGCERKKGKLGYLSRPRAVMTSYFHLIAHAYRPGTAYFFFFGAIYSETARAWCEFLERTDGVLLPGVEGDWAIQVAV
jgi:hypothetical protein